MLLLRLASLGPRLVTSLLADGLNLVARPLALASFFLPSWPTLSAFTSGGFFYGFLGTVSTVLTLCSLGVLVLPFFPKVAIKMVAGVYLFDAVAQLARMIDPSVPYPTSSTGFLTLNLQLPVSLLPVLADNRALADLASAYFSRWLLLAGAISLRFMSLELFRDSASGHLLWGGSLVLALFAATPSIMWATMFAALKRVGKALATVCSAVYAAVTYV
ncbi:Uncharacterized protein SCF082_LOCUS19311, partial [Durusdinium trenchii]